MGMKKLALAALAATFAVLSAAAPAMAEEGRHEGRTAKKVVIHRDHGRHEGWRHRNVKKVMLHRDRGRHEGWRHRNVKKVVIKHGGHHGGKTVIKKKIAG